MNLAISSVKANQTDDTASDYSRYSFSASSTLDSMQEFCLRLFRIATQVKKTHCPSFVDEIGPLLILGEYYKVSDPAVYEIIAKQNLYALLINFYTVLKSKFPHESFRLEEFLDPEEDSSSLEPRLAITILTKSDDIEGNIDRHYELFLELRQRQEDLSPQSQGIFLFIEYVE